MWDRYDGTGECRRNRSATRRACLKCVDGVIVPGCAYDSRPAGEIPQRTGGLVFRRWHRGGSESKAADWP